MGRRTKAQSLLTRDALERAARELFLEQGYDGVTLEDVAARAGVTRGALYHHFGSKHGLFEAVTLTVHAEVAAHVLGAAEAAGEGWPGIEAGCWAFLESAASPNVQRILLVDAPVVLGWQHWRSMDAANSRRLLEEGLIEMESAGLLGVDARAAAVLISGALNEGALWLAENPDDDAATQVRTAVQQMLRALRASGGDSGS